ncbi:MAG: aminotransferase class V-fold PLP-dependent enzyme, partial [bacterium]
MKNNNSQKKIYFDNAATSFPKPNCVIEAMLTYIKDIGCNVNRGNYSTAYSVEEVLFNTRDKLTQLFNGDDCKNTVFTSNITISLNILLKGLLKPGDH